jgi:hypothetical protein
MRAIYVLFVSLPFIACDVRPKTQANQGSKPASIQEQPKKDGWQRMKDCADLSDLMTKRMGWVEGAHTDDHTVQGWVNHYSPKYERCYVQVGYLNRLAKKDKSLPLLYEELWDAFENRLVAVCTTSSAAKSEDFCLIPDAKSESDIGCQACRQFVDDRMNN